MGMTIDEAIEIISDIDKAYRTFSNMEYKAMQKSIDVMRKYQHIQEIMHKEYASDQADVCLVQRLVEIREVLEDGND